MRQLVPALVAAVAATVLLGGCSADEGGTASEPAPSQTPRTLTDEALLAADEVPARDRLTAWRPADPTPEVVLACQATTLDDLGAPAYVYRRYVANIAEAPEGDPSSAVDLAVVQYDDEQAAEDAAGMLQDEVEACDPTVEDLGTPYVVEGSHEVVAGGGTLVWRQRDVTATDVCTDCDAVRFHRMGVGVVGTRVVLVSLAEVGGPLQPEGLDPTMEALSAAAMERAAAS